MEDIETLKKNCIEYAKTTKKSLDVLREANGIRRYTEIAKIIGLHNTAISGLLKKAEKLGLAEKIKPGIYKKIPGVLGYMPHSVANNSPKMDTAQNIINKIGKIRAKNKRRVFSLPKSISLPQNIGGNLAKMANAYCALYVVENILRILIRKVLSSKVDWWKNFVPPGIQTDISLAISKTPYHAASRNDELEYTHLGQLKEIIIYGKNWDNFLLFLNEKNKNYFMATIDKALPSRHAIAHSIPLKIKDLRVVDIRFDDILKMINKNQL